MAFEENVQLFLILKQRIEVAQTDFVFKGLIHAFKEFRERDHWLFFAGVSRPQSDKQVRICRKFHFLRLEFQGFNKPLAQLGQEVQRAAQKGHVAFNRVAAGQTGDRLVNHSLQHGSGDVCLFCPVVDQRLNICLRKDPAARRDRVNCRVLLGQLVEPCGIGLEQCRHLIDEGPGPAGAGAVHPLFHTRAKECDFRVFAAQLNGAVRFWNFFFDGTGTGHHFLNKWNVQPVRC